MTERVRVSLAAFSLALAGLLGCRSPAGQVGETTPAVAVSEHVKDHDATVVGATPRDQDGGRGAMATDDSGAVRGGVDDELKRIREEMARVRGGAFKVLPPDTVIPETPSVEQESRMWAERFFRDLASPWRRFSRRDRSIHLAGPDTPDVLRHEYAVQVGLADGGSLPLRLSILETNSKYLVWVEGADDLLALPLEDARERIRQIADGVLKMEGTGLWLSGPTPYHWEFQIPDVREGVTFTSDPTVRLLRVMPGWWSRIDGGIARGQLYFILHKRIPNTSGPWIWLDERSWFSGKYLNAYNRGQFRQPPSTGRQP